MQSARLLCPSRKSSLLDFDLPGMTACSVLCPQATIRHVQHYRQTRNASESLGKPTQGVPRYPGMQVFPAVYAAFEVLVSPSPQWELGEGFSCFRDHMSLSSALYQTGVSKT